jgi:lysozyme family protein
MANFDLAIQTVLQHEGGYVNDPADCGGETKFGICQRSYPDVNIRNLDAADAKAIYRHDFWAPLHLDEVRDQAVASKILDSAVLLGKTAAVKLIQRALQNAGGGIVPIDGLVGPQTLTAINLASPLLLISEYRKLLAARFETLAVRVPTNQKFLKGLLTRANS